MKILGQSLISKIETEKNKSIRRLITFKKKLNYSSDIFFFFFLIYDQCSSRLFFPPSF